MDIDWIKTQFPDLQNLGLLNNGGQKVVFSGLHLIEGDIVLKIIRPMVDIETVKREIYAVQKIACNRVPVIYAYGSIKTQIGPCFWLREKRINGQNVRQILVNGPLPVRQIITMALHITEALQRAEEESIVHRDIKPDNVINDLSDEFWLIDFGIARHLRLDSQTATSAPFGKFTPGYAPPEQFRNLKSDISSQADLFALGITLYECAVGMNPFRHGAANELEMLDRVERLQLIPLRRCVPQASTLSDFVDALTQKRRHHRLSSVREAVNWITEIKHNLNSYES